MLQKIYISNYAIIEELSLAFPPGLNVITGETGAGKSILMGGLNLILGQRADTTVLLNKEKKCVVEATFQISHNTGIENFFHDNNLDYSAEIIVRREISVNGKSRAFVNDTPVNLSHLKLLSTFLVDLNQQFETLELGTADFQREALDAIAGNNNLLVNMKENFARYSLLYTRLQKLQEEQAVAIKEKDYHQFLFDELDGLNFKPNELEDLDEELKILSNAEEIKIILDEVTSALSNAEDPLTAKLKSLQYRLHSIENMHPGLQELQKRILGTMIEVQDIADELEGINSHVQVDANRMEIVNDRISEGYKLLKKHNLKTTAELLDLSKELSSKLYSYISLAETITALKNEVADAEKDCQSISASLHAVRKMAIPLFTKNINALLTEVGMPLAKVDILLSRSQLSETGGDTILFLFDANNSGRTEALHKVASGGELSRLMLSIKSLVAKKLSMPTLIFDEIDSGVSGEAARQVAHIMHEMSDGHQLIVISHQPQIAAQADNHFYVHKVLQSGSLRTMVKPLTSQERIDAIAKMIGGEKPTNAAIKNAAELMERRSRATQL